MNGVSLSLRDLSFNYPGGELVLDGLNLEVAAGQSLGLVGANGAGKSTLLLHLVGICTPVSGQVFVDGVLLSPSTLARVRRIVGLMFQDPADQLFMPTVREEVGFAPTNHGLSAADCAERVDALLAQLGIAALAERAPVQLSGGERRLVALAAVLAQNPSVLLFDEPSAGLDPRGRRRLIERLRQLPETRLVASHDLDLVWEACDVVAILSEGQVAMIGPTRELLADRALLADCGLELPLRLQQD
jgi:cobalt/nickel transport system ATP-binding protein